MAKDSRPYTEPVPVPDAFATGTEVEKLDGTIRIVAWVDMAKERRIVGRWVMSGSTARGLVAGLRSLLMRGGN